MKKSLLILFAIIIAININTQAEDFLGINDGDTIYYKITSITLPYEVEVTYRGVSASTYSNEYYGSVSIPDSVQYNGNYYKVTSIGISAFKSCTSLTSLIIPPSVKTIAYSPFANCSNLISIIIPSSVTSIGSSAFYACTSLTSIIIPSSVTSIGDGVFSACTGLTSITIPSSITSIGTWAFNNCSGLTSITCNAIIPPSAQSNSFYGVNKTIPFYVPCNSAASYQSALFWSEFTNKIAFRTPQYITSSICEGDSYTNYGANIDSAGVYNLVSGCDSVILTLNINQTYFTNYYDTICKGQIYNNYGFNFIADTTGLYTQNINTINGCDSIVNLNLIVNPTPDVPSNLIINQKPNYFEITWQSNGMSYDIYRDDSLIANISQPIYLDYNLIAGQPYCYKVKALIGECESGFSNIVCKSYSGLDNIESNNITTRLYPNPTDNITKLKVVGLKSDAELILYDIFGRVIHSCGIRDGNSEMEIDVRGFAKGIYTIRIVNEDFNQATKLIVK